MRYSLDTNILVRLVVGDHPTLSPAAADLVRNNDCHLSVIALAEMGYVLMSVYDATIQDVAVGARKLVALPTVEVENAVRVLKAVQAAESGMDWFDAMLWAALPNDCTLATFDRKFANRATRLQWQPAVQSVLP